MRAPLSKLYPCRQAALDAIIHLTAREAGGASAPEVSGSRHRAFYGLEDLCIRVSELDGDVTLELVLKSDRLGTAHKNKKPVGGGGGRVGVYHWVEQCSSSTNNMTRVIYNSANVGTAAAAAAAVRGSYSGQA